MNLLHFLTILTSCFLTRIICASVPIFDRNSSIRYNPSQNHFKDYRIEKQENERNNELKEIRFDLIKQEIEKCKGRLPDNVDIMIRIYSPSSQLSQIRIKDEEELEFFDHIYDPEKSFNLPQILEFVNSEQLPPIRCSLNGFDRFSSSNEDENKSILIDPSQEVVHDPTFIKRSPIGRHWQKLKNNWHNATPGTKTKVALGVGLGTATLGAIATPYAGATAESSPVEKRNLIKQEKEITTTTTSISQDGKKVSIHEEDESVIFIGHQGAAPMKKRNLNELIGTAGMGGMLGGMIIGPAVNGLKGHLFHNRNKNGGGGQQQQQKRKRSISSNKEQTYLVKRSPQPRPVGFGTFRKVFKTAATFASDIKKVKNSKRSLPFLDESKVLLVNNDYNQIQSPLLLSSNTRCQNANSQQDYTIKLEKRFGKLAKLVSGIGHAGNIAMVTSTAGGIVTTFGSGWNSKKNAAAAAGGAVPKKRSLIVPKEKEEKEEGEILLEKRAGRVKLTRMKSVGHKPTNTSPLKPLAPRLTRSKSANAKPTNTSPLIPKKSNPPPKLTKSESIKHSSPNTAPESPQKMGKMDKLGAVMGVGMSLSMITSTASEVKGWVSGGGNQEQQGSAPASPGGGKRRRDLFEFVEKTDYLIIGKGMPKYEKIIEQSSEKDSIPSDGNSINIGRKSRIEEKEERDEKVIIEKENDNGSQIIFVKRAIPRGLAGIGGKALGAVEVAGNASMFVGMATPLAEPIGKGAKNLWDKVKSIGKKKKP